MATTKKVMDVAKPEDTKPDIGSKPMIVGHKSMATDPMVREAESPVDTTTSPADQKKDDKPAVVEEKIAPPSEKQKNLAPIKETEVEKPAEVANVEATNEDAPLEGAKIVEKQDPIKTSDEVPTEKTTDTKSDDTATETTEEKKPEIDPVAAEMEKQDDLQKMIASKKYFVSVKQAKKSNPALKALTTIFLVLSLFGALFYLIDTDKLDLGFDLPFNVFGKVETQAAPVPSEPVVPTEQPVVEETPAAAEETISYANEAFGVSFEYPTSWGTVAVEQINGYSDQTYETELPYFLSVVFSKKTEVSMRLINGRAFEGGRGFEGPLASATYFQSFIHQFSYQFIENGKSFSLVRVSNDDVAKSLSSGTLTEEQYSFSLANEGITLVVQPNWTKENLNLLPWDEEKYGTTEAAATEELAKLDKKTFYVHNFASEKIIGANATYTWSADTQDKTINDQIVALFKSIK